MAAWSMTRWHKSGQSCIRPSIGIPPYGSLLLLRLLPNGCTSLAAEPVQSEADDVASGPALRHQVGQDFTDRRGELEAVAGAGRGDQDVRRRGQAADQEIAVGRHGVEARLGGPERPCRRRNVSSHEWADPRFALRRDDTIDMVRI